MAAGAVERGYPRFRSQTVVTGRSTQLHCLSFIFRYQQEHGSYLEAVMFGPSHSHRVWRMMNTLIDAQPQWADSALFEQAREKILRYGTSTGMSLEELFRITDPATILGLWTTAEAADDQV